MITRGSLGARLLGGAALWVALALLATGLVLGQLFREHVVEQYDRELEGVLDQLTAAASLRATRLELAPEPAGPHFHRPYGGRYWQVTAGDVSLRSRSLWDQVLPAAAPAPPGEIRTTTVDAPGLGRVRVLERSAVLVDAPGQPVRFQAAMPLAEIEEVTTHFNRLLAIALSVLGVLLLLAAMIQVTLGLRPLARLRRDVGRVRAGEAGRLAAEQPAEVAPLVDEINALLADNEAMVARARAQAADLAHGIKTSLQLVALEAERLDAAEVAGPARVIAREVALIRGQLEQQLARVRAGGRQHSRIEQADVAHSIERIARTIQALAADRGIAIACTVDPRHRFAGNAADLEEMLGNLLDNAAKWARQRVSVCSTFDSDRLVLVVDDDGPGLPAKDRELVFARGARLDGDRPGSGLGLAITRDIASLYGGKVTLDAGPRGGLRSRLDLPGRLAPAPG